MHEVSIMAEAVRLAMESARAAGAPRVTGLRLRVGSLSGAVPEALRFAWDVVRRDTPAAEAWLEIESVPSACWCGKWRGDVACGNCLRGCPRGPEFSVEVRRWRDAERDVWGGYG